ncbi:MAG: hemerythrin domain-containing protein, partial [Actinomycetota bacterium]|nr:hemerythrin domain-containing protein [Actinomycetota bacterium]
LEGFEEHHVVNGIVAELGAVPFDDETWGAKLTVMRENVEHHIDEEENEMFSKARQVLDEEDLAELGVQMQARKDELMGENA